MAEDPQPLTLQQRIASLNAAHVVRAPGVPPAVRPKPQVPTKRPVVVRNKPIHNPLEQVNGSIADSTTGNQPNGLRKNGLIPPPTITRPTGNGTKQHKSSPPPLPTRQRSLPPPSLPARRPPEQEIRRDSVESNSSGASGGSAYSNGTSQLTIARTRSNDSASRVKAPAWGEAELPPLPARGTEAIKSQYSSERPKYAVRAPSSSTEVPTPAILADQAPQPLKAKPSLPPRLPPRKQIVEPSTILQQTTIEHENERKIPPLPSAAELDKVKRSALSFGLNKEVDIPPQPAVQEVETHDPPPVPLGSRPDLSALQASKPRPSGSATTVASMSQTNSISCLTCRDFSAPDHYASLFPRSQVTSIPQLAQQLTSPFPSLTDKARAIFTWLHHNVRYDVDSFFAGNVRPSTPQSTLQSGLAVCEGYAALFTNLATHAGLESVVISGHGKGYGYTPLAPGSPIPPYNAGHAWNAVRIDDGEWKLLDACWGAGHVQGKGQPYIAKFTPQYFTMSNEEFGIKHFPGNKDMFFLPEGRRMSWEEYIQINPASWPLQVEAPTIFTSSADYGVGERTVMPRSRKISLKQGGVIRFQFSLYCPHWTVEGHTKKGPPPVFIIATHGVDGRNKDYVPLEHIRGQNPGGGGDFWYCDVEARELGAAGQTVTLFAITSFGDRQNTRGLTVREFKESKGRVGMGFQGVAAWDLI
jgi:transglutaminase-like putative cysteine protease